MERFNKIWDFLILCNDIVGENHSCLRVDRLESTLLTSGHVEITSIRLLWFDTESASATDMAQLASEIAEFFGANTCSIEINEEDDRIVTIKVSDFYDNCSQGPFGDLENPISRIEQLWEQLEASELN